MKFYIDKCILFSFLLLLSLGANAQLTLISGQVSDVNTGAPVPFISVAIDSYYDSINSTGINYHHTVVTNSQGYYIDTVSQVGINTLFYLTLLDCNLQVQSDTFNSSNPLPVDFDICSNPTPCQADFYVYADSSDYRKIHFKDASTGNPNTYFWTFGDGGSGYSFLANDTWTYSADGTYQIVLTINTNNCTHTFTDSVIVSPTLESKADFSYQIFQQQSAVEFTGETNNAYYTIYQWDFGDGTYGSGTKIMHKYATPGTYQVNLVATALNWQTLDTAVSFKSKSVYVPAPLKGDIFGQVFLDTNIVDYGQAILFTYGEVDSSLHAIDTVSITSVDSLNLSFYYFNDVLYGDYAIKAELLNTSAFYYNYAPAYTGNTLFWDAIDLIKLDTIVHNSPTNSINLKPIFPSYGTASIGGNVYEGSQISPGDPIENMHVYLLDENRLIKDYTQTDYNGEYLFLNLDNQKYFVYVDAVNHQPNEPMIIPSASVQIFDNIDIYLNPVILNLIDQVDIDYEISFYPNPTSDNLTIDFLVDGDGVNTFSLYTVYGQLLTQNTIANIGGKQQYEMKLDQYSSGVYLLKMQLANGHVLEKKIIKR